MSREIECIQLVSSSYVQTPEEMAKRGYEPTRNISPQVRDIIAMEGGGGGDWVVERLTEKVDAVVVTIAAGTSPITEGTNATFTVFRAAAGDTHLTVLMEVAESGSMLSGNGWPRSVTIPANATNEIYTVVTRDDDVEEDASDITATVKARTGYTVGTEGSAATVTVNDNEVPFVKTLSITSSPGADGFYSAGDTIQVTVKFSDSVTVTGTPELTLRVGLDHKAAKYKSGSPGTALVFQYDVEGGVNDTDGVSVPSGKIKLGTDGEIDATNGGGAAWLSTAGRGLRDQAEHKVDTAPEVADAETTTDGERIVVTFSEPIDGRTGLTGDFTLSVDGTAVTPSAASFSIPSVLYLHISPAVTSGQALSLAYAPNANRLQDLAGNDLVNFTEEVTNTVTGTAPVQVLVTVGTPADLAAAAAGSSRIDLSWTAPEGDPTGYNVEWSPDGQLGTWRPVDPAHDGAATTYGHTGLNAETAYHYRVRAVNDDGPGEWSAVASATTEAATQQKQQGEPPPAPNNVSAGASGQSRIEVSWSAPKGEVTGYEVEWSADGSGSWTAADPAHGGTATGYSDTGLDAGTTRHYRVRAVNDAGSGEWSGPASATTQRPELTARFEQAPAEHEGPDSTFTLRLVFSEAVAASYRNLRDHAITATNGAVRKSERVNGSSAEWNVTVAPSSREAVTVSVSGGSDACSQGDAVCTEDGRRLSNSPSVTVEGPPAVPLTAELDGVPGEHDGESTFTFGLTFSEEPRVSYRTLRDEAFDVGGGAVRNARRRQSGSDLSWEITVEPSSHRDVSIRLPETGSCSAVGAICTADGRPLSHALSASVRGPAAMSVSDARVEEAVGAAVAFAVTLSRAASDRVTVDYQTRDGSAQAGEDYRAASGTLTFSAGESSKTIEVTVLDDAHDEGEETFTLALSNASGAWLEDAEATGTIENADLMPAALLARFGRATAEQVVEHVAERMAAPRERGFRARFAGRELRPGMERDFALGFLSQFGQPMGMGPGGAAPMGANPMGAAMGATSMGATSMAPNPMAA